MTEPEFDRLCKAAAGVLFIAEPIRVDGGFIFQLEGVEFILAFNAENDANQIYCYMDLGAPLPDEKARICELILELNLEFDGSEKSGVYAFEPESGRAVYCRPLQYSGWFDGGNLANLLENCISETLDIRQMIENPCRDINTKSKQLIPSFFIETLA